MDGVSGRAVPGVLGHIPHAAYCTRIAAVWARPRVEVAPLASKQQEGHCLIYPCKPAGNALCSQIPSQGGNQNCRILNRRVVDR